MAAHPDASPMALNITKPNDDTGIQFLLPANLNFDGSLGVFLISGLVASALWGVTCVQTYSYFMSQKKMKDRTLLKVMVVFLWFLDTASSVLNGAAMYHYMVVNFMNPMALITPVWSIIIHIALTSISNFFVRFLFTQRIYRLSRGNIWITGWVMVLSTAGLVIGIFITVKIFQVPSFLDLSKLEVFIYVMFAASVGSDLSVAGSLCWLLCKSRTGFLRTDSLIKILMLYVVNTGMIVAVDATLGMIFFIVMPHNMVFLVFYLLLSKLYFNAYLASLNARDGLKQKKEEMVSIHLSHLSDQSKRYKQDVGADVESTRGHNLNRSSTAAEKAENTSAHRPMAISIHTYVDHQIEEPHAL